MNTSLWMKKLIQSAQQNSPAILSGLAAAGVVGTVVLAVRATPDAMMAIRQAEEDKAEEQEAKKSPHPGTSIKPLKLTVPETVKATWKVYLPASLAGAGTLACIFGAHRIGARRNAAIIGAYTLVDTAFRQYKDEVVQQIGEAKERKIHDAVAAHQVDANPPSTQLVILGGGDVLCYDTLTGRYFKSDHESIRRAENEINRRVITDMYAPHNEFYVLLGLPTLPIGDELGWNIEHMLELVFTSHLSEECGQPALVVGYKNFPVKDYGRVF